MAPTKATIEEIISEMFPDEVFINCENAFKNKIKPDNKCIRRPPPRVDPELVELGIISAERLRKVEIIRKPYTAHDSHILGNPLIELSSVCIHLDDGNPSFDVYGFICLVDDDKGGVEHLFFNHEFNDPVNVKSKDKQPATIHKTKLQGPFLLPGRFKLKLKLVDKIRDVVIIDTVTAFHLDDIVYDKEHEFTFYGNGMVTLNYTMLKCGLLARVALTVLKNRGRSICDTSVVNDIVSGIDVGGTISATTVMESGEEISRVIFDPEKDTGMFLTPHTLLLPLAVPAYSFLQLKADLVVDGQPFVSDFALEFTIAARLVSKEIVGQKWRIIVVVNWSFPHESNDMEQFFRSFQMMDLDPIPPGLPRRVGFLDPEKSSTDYPPEQSEQHSGCGNKTTDHSEQGCFLELATKEGSSEGSTTSIKRQRSVFCLLETNSDHRYTGKSPIEEPQQKRYKLLHDELLSDVSNQSIQPVFKILKYNRKLVEVFSIYIGSFGCSGDALQLYGKISSYDYFNLYEIFKRDKINAVKLHPHTNVVPVEQPHCYEAYAATFGMFFDLKDVEGHEISRGYVEWGLYGARSMYGNEDKRLCSIVRGKHGFAAVHYTIFEHGVSANLKVTLLSEKSSDVCRVHGKIWGSYSTYEYKKVYEKEYYQSMIFEKGRAEYVEVQPMKKQFVEAGGGGGGVPLSKRKVAVPVDASFIVEVDLNVEGEYGEALRGIASYNYVKPKRNKIHSEVVKIEGRNYSLWVCVDWR